MTAQEAMALARTALEFYATDNNWSERYEKIEGQIHMSYLGVATRDDGGKRARAALQALASVAPPPDAEPCYRCSHCRAYQPIGLMEPGLGHRWLCMDSVTCEDRASVESPTEPDIGANPNPIAAVDPPPAQDQADLELGGLVRRMPACGYIALWRTFAGWHTQDGSSKFSGKAYGTPEEALQAVLPAALATAATEPREGSKP